MLPKVQRLKIRAFQCKETTFESHQSPVLLLRNWLQVSILAVQNWRQINFVSLYPKRIMLPMTTTSKQHGHTERAKHYNLYSANRKQSSGSEWTLKINANPPALCVRSGKVSRGPCQQSRRTCKALSKVANDFPVNCEPMTVLHNKKPSPLHKH